MKKTYNKLLKLRETLDELMIKMVWQDKDTGECWSSVVINRDNKSIVYVPGDGKSMVSFIWDGDELSSPLSVFKTTIDRRKLDTITLDGLQNIAIIAKSKMGEDI